MMLHMKKESSMMKHHREKKIAVDGELTCIGRNCMTCHMHLVKKLQDPLVKFICVWHRFVTKKSFEETVQLGESESGELKRCLRLCELFFLCLASCLCGFQMPSRACKSMKEALAELLSDASCVRITTEHCLENIFHGCMNVEMAKLKLRLMSDVEKPKELAWDVA